MQCRLPRRIGILADGVNYVEYIQNAIGAYIDLGITGNQNTEVEIKANIVSSTTTHAFLFGNAKTSSQAISISPSVSTTTTSGNSRFGSQSKSGTFNVSTGEWHVFTINNLGCYVDGVAVHTWSGTVSDFITNGTLWLFALNGGTKNAVNQIEYCKISESGELAYDYRAALDADGVPSMYDKISKTYLYNAGTEAFTAGAAISGGDSSTKYTVTIEGASEINDSYVTINGTTYTANQTIAMQAGASISIYVKGVGDDAYLYLNGNRIETGDPINYTFVPSSNVTIRFEYDDYQYCYITTESADSTTPSEYAVVIDAGTDVLFADSLEIVIDGTSYVESTTVQAKAGAKVSIQLLVAYQMDITFNGTSVYSKHGVGTYEFELTANTTIVGKAGSSITFTITTE